MDANVGTARDVTVRPLRDGDRAAALAVEAAAIKGVAYLDDVWGMFTRGGDGDLSGVFAGGELAGIGKLTALFGGYGWLELLRVHPDYQRRGMGKAIYRRYLEEAAERGLTALGMYTGETNAASRGLAERFGLRLRGRFMEYTLPLDGSAPAGAAEDGMGAAAGSPGVADYGFQRVPEADGEGAMAPHYGATGGFVSVNRTFYPARAGLGRHLAARGWLYAGADGSVLVAGARFQPQKALHVTFLYDAGTGVGFEAGESARAMVAFCASLARRAGARALTCEAPADDEAKNRAMLACGFSDTGTRLITLWSGL